MDTATLQDWASTHGTDLEPGHDHALSLTSKVLRFRWKSEPTVAVPVDATAKARINAVLDGLAWHRARFTWSDAPLNVILGEPQDTSTARWREECGAAGTLTAAFQGPPAIRLWSLGADDTPKPLPVSPAQFNGSSPARWAALMSAWASCPVKGLALERSASASHTRRSPSTPD